MAQGAHHKPHQLPLHMSTWGKQAQPGTEGHSLMSLQRPGTSMEQAHGYLRTCGATGGCRCLELQLISTSLLK